VESREKGGGKEGIESMKGGNREEERRK